MISDPLSFSIPFPHSSLDAPILPPRPIRKLLYPAPGEPDSYILEFSNSSLEPFTICQAKAEKRIVYSRQGRRSHSSLLFGGLFHRLEERRLRDGLSEEVEKWQLQQIQEHFDTYPSEPGDHRTREKMLAIITKYNNQYRNDGWPGNVLKDKDGVPIIERPFKLELCTIPVNAEVPYSPHLLIDNYQGTNVKEYFYVRNIHILYTGLIDAIIKESTLNWIVDHKSTKDANKAYYEAFRLSSQTVGYAYAAREILGEPIAGLMLNAVIARPPVKTHSSLPREEFNRVPYFYNDDRLDDWKNSTSAIAADFISSLARGFFPLSAPSSYKSPCVYCEYHMNCQQPRENRLSDLYSDIYENVTRTPIHDIE